MIYPNGRIYEGGWKKDQRNGEGYESYSNGNTYEGGFKDGKAFGYGVYKWKSGEIYEGEWEKGKKYGFGIWKSKSLFIIKLKINMETNTQDNGKMIKLMEKDHIFGLLEKSMKETGKNS